MNNRFVGKRSGLTSITHTYESEEMIEVRCMQPIM
jgi:hypothetical protein